MLDGSPRWVEIAIRELVAGVHEIAGEAHSLRVLDYHQTTNLKASDDETAWCAAFAEFCLRQSFIKGTGRAHARSYLEWGQEIAEPRVGAIVILWRGEPNGWQGHVGFLLGWSNTHIILIGGNQGNAVSVQSYPIQRLLGYRWPHPLDRFT